MSPEQVKMARSALGLGVRELGEISGVSYVSISRFETGKSGLHHSTAESIRKALEAEGIQFLKSGEVAKGDGVALKSED